MVIFTIKEAFKPSKRGYVKILGNVPLI